MNRTTLLFLVLLLFSCERPAHNAAPHDPAKQIESNSAGEASQPGSIRVMSYNVLRFGDGCQGDSKPLYSYLNQIVSYAKPDILGLIKLAAIGKRAPKGFEDSVLKYALNRSGNHHYSIAPFSNSGDAKDINLLAYDNEKFGFSGVRTMTNDVTDFNLYKLFYKASSSKGDTAFLYVLLLHTESGDNSKDRDRQLLALSVALHKAYKTMPQMLVLGDFNLRNTNEPGYKALTQQAGGALFDDPPFAIDKTFSYPSDWDSDPTPFTHFLTTSTRKKDDKPNSCGTGGGAKSWYDHILISHPAAGRTGPFGYVAKSFHVVGNDGDRLGRSVYSDKHPNKAVPAAVAEALFQFSNKYPVMLELSVSR